MGSPTNQDLARLITNIQTDTRDFRKETKQGFKDVHKKVDGMNSKIQTLDTFMAVQKDRQRRAAIDWSGVLKQGLVAVTIALTIFLTLIQVASRMVET